MRQLYFFKSNEINLDKFSRIAISGSHNVGKTTLAKRMSENFGLTYFPEVARELLHLVPKNHYFNFREADFNQYTLFENAILYGHLFYISVVQDNFIVDRSLLDILAYCEYFIQKNGNFPSLETTKVAIQNLIGSELNLFYDCILFYNNGYNEKDESGEFISYYIEVLGKYIKIPFIEINKGDTLLKNNTYIVV